MRFIDLPPREQANVMNQPLSIRNAFLFDEISAEDKKYLNTLESDDWKFCFV